MWFSLVAAVITAGLIYYLLISKGNKDFWKKYGIREVDTSNFISAIDLLLGRKSLFEADDYVYSKIGSEKFCGAYEQGRPIMVIKDLDLLKKILIKDFDHFVDRRQFFSDSDGSLHKMLPNLQADEWKGVRSSVSPTFTTGKIRRMMEYFNGVGKEWVDDLTKKAKSNAGSIKIDVTSTVNQYTVEVIAKSVFGMSVGTIKNPDSEFSKMANRIADVTTFRIIMMAIRLQFPTIAKKLGLNIVDKKAINFFEDILSHGLKQRMNGKITRNDFLQLLVEAKKGELKSVGSDELSTFEKEAQINTGSTTGAKAQYLTDEVMNAQSVVFFFAGFSTTTNFISFALYALALNPKVQDKLREEVGKIATENGDFDYDVLGQLVYLDMVVCEVLRKFSAAARLERMCVREYKDPETGLIVPKGVIVAIPLNSIHHDTKYYDNPDKFDPEHFSPEKKTERSPYAYMPFGMGPRNCIGMRFALVEGKAAIAHIVQSFKIEPTDKTPIPLQGKPAGLMLMPPKGLELKLTPISKH